MDHAAIDAENVAERYVAGKLEPAEAARFEVHYLDCPACIERVEAAERLQRGLARVAAEEAARPALVAGLLAAAARFARSRPGALLLTALLLVVLVPAVLAVRQLERLQGDLDRARSELAGRGVDTSVERLAAVEAELAAAESELAAMAEERARAEERLAAAERARQEESRRADGQARRPAAGERPRADATLVALTPVRGSGEGPVFPVSLPRDPAPVAFWIELGETGAPAYRATLLGPGGGVLWRGEGLETNTLGALLVTFPPGYLSPGEHELHLDALPAAGEPLPAARFRLRIEAAE